MTYDSQCPKGGLHVRTYSQIYVGDSWVVTVDDLLRYQRMRDRGDSPDHRYAYVCLKCRKELS